MLRVLVDEFAPTRAQRRCLARNRDLLVAVPRHRATDEKRALYRRYLESRHDGTMSGSADEMASFLYDAPPFTVEVTYRARARLVAVGIADVEPQALSAVYCYFDPAEARRSLGVFNVLTLLAECRERALPYLYLGYYVAGCPSMEYKSLFLPNQILGPDGAWHDFRK